MMRHWQCACLAFFVAATVWGGAARAAVIAEYEFTGNTLAPTTVGSNATAGNITGSPNVNNQPTSVLTFVSGVGYPSDATTSPPALGAQRANSGEAGVRDNVYFTFTVTPDAGYELDLSSLTFNVARGGASAPRDYDIRSSLDNFATSLTGIVSIPTARPAWTPASVDLSGPQFQNLTAPLTFQFRYFTPTVSQNVDFDDVTINGMVAVVPEPSAIAVLAASVAWVFWRRRAV